MKKIVALTWAMLLCIVIAGAVGILYNRYQLPIDSAAQTAKLIRNLDGR